MADTTINQTNGDLITLVSRSVHRLPAFALISDWIIALLTFIVITALKLTACGYLKLPEYCGVNNEF